MTNMRSVFLGFLLIRPIITIQSFSSSSLYVQVRQEESFEEESTFARPPPPRRRPDSFQAPEQSGSSESGFQSFGSRQRQRGSQLASQQVSRGSQRSDQSVRGSLGNRADLLSQVEA